MVRLVFLGKFRPLASAALSTAEPPASIVTLAQLRDWVMRQAPGLGAALATTSLRLVVNNAIVHDLSKGFAAGDEIAFLPSMSGG